MASTLNNTALQRVLCWLFARIYKRWLWNDWYKEYETPIKVTGWRSALVGYGKNLGMRRGVTPCFWIFK